MRLGFAILADASTIEGGKFYCLGGGWNSITVPELPADWNFAVVVGLDIAWDETNDPSDIRMEVQDPDGGDLGNITFEDVEAGRPPGLLRGQEQRAVLSMNANLTFRQTGPHAAILFANDDEIGRTRFYVRKLPAA